MENSKSRSSIKKKLLITAVSCLAALFLVVPNVLLAVYKEKLSARLNSISPLPLSLGSAFYLPPRLLILKNICLYEDSPAPENKIISLPEIYIAFSPLYLLKNGGFRVLSLRCIGPNADWQRLHGLVRQNYKQILDFIWSAPRQDIEISLKEAVLFCKKKDASVSRLSADSAFRMKGDSFYLKWRAGDTACELQGTAGKNSVNLEKMKFANRALDGELWGRISRETAELKGFLFLNNSGIGGRSSPDNIFILDIDSRVKFGYPLFEIEKLNCTVNNNPVRIKAGINLERPYSCDIEAGSAFRGFRKMGKDTLKDISLQASLLLRGDNSLLLDGKADIVFPEWQKEPLPLQAARLLVNGMEIPLETPMPREIKISSLELFCRTNTDSYLAKLDGLNAILRPGGGNAKIIQYSSAFHKGRLKGTARAGLKNYSPVITAFADIENAEANELKEIIPQFSKMHGKISGRMMFSNYPQWMLKGSMHTVNGRLENFSFFKWLGDMFMLPQLNDIAFRSAGTDFLVDKDGAGLDKIRLDSDNVKLYGSFRLSKEAMVASKISLAFPRSLLKGSPKFTPLLGMLNRNVSVLNFNFQLSGRLNDMNFQWLRSDFKDQLQKAIPDFAEAGFEEKLQNAIESISGQ